MTTLYPEPTATDLRIALCIAHGRFVAFANPDVIKNAIVNGLSAEAAADIEKIMPWLKKADK